MRHDPNNGQCDKNQYGDAPDVRCTCDVDDPADAPAPSTVVEQGPVRSSFASAAISREVTGAVTLTGRQAATHRELEAAGVELQAAQDLYRKAEARWKAALDAHMQAILPGART